MIKVERLPSGPSSLTEEQNEGGQLGKAILYFTEYFELQEKKRKESEGLLINLGETEVLEDEGSEKRKSFHFKKYNNDDVKELLNNMFHHKCAYCESKYEHLHPMEIEHFRPKAIVQQDRADKRKLAGYYWLAWDWDNLFPSCINCNRVSYQKTLEEGKVLMGKGNLFPLEDENYRALTHNHDINIEVPLLLNPCKEDPAEHIEFTNEGVIRPKLIDESESIKGKISINTYALNRYPLTIEREGVAKQIKNQIEQVKYEIENVIHYPNDQRFERKLSLEMQILHSYMEPDKLYSQMAKQIISRFLTEMGLEQITASHSVD